MDCAAYLEYLQTVFREFDISMVILDPVLIYLFCNCLRPSIYTQANQDSRKKNIWK